MRLLHAADLPPRFPASVSGPERPRTREEATRRLSSALARLVDAAIDEDVAALLLAGDIFDNGVGDVRAASPWPRNSAAYRRRHPDGGEPRQP